MRASWPVIVHLGGLWATLLRLLHTAPLPAFTAHTLREVRSMNGSKSPGWLRMVPSSRHVLWESSFSMKEDRGTRAVVWLWALKCVPRPVRRGDRGTAAVVQSCGQVGPKEEEARRSSRLGLQRWFPPLCPGRGRAGASVPAAAGAGVLTEVTTMAVAQLATVQAAVAAVLVVAVAILGSACAEAQAETVWEAQRSQGGCPLPRSSLQVSSLAHARAGS